jgi:GNAT superfamily N-acetyltransferase
MEKPMETELKNGQCVELRTASAADLQSVFSLLDRSGLPTAGVADNFSQFLVAEADGRLVGVVGLELYGESALLRSAAVEESWRGSGVGRVLVERALDLARDRGRVSAHHNRRKLFPEVRLRLCAAGRGGPGRTIFRGVPGSLPGVSDGNVQARQQRPRRRS